jgi:hypothetical protein
MSNRGPQPVASGRQPCRDRVPPKLESEGQVSSHDRRQISLTSCCWPLGSLIPHSQLTLKYSSSSGCWVRGSRHHGPFATTAMRAAPLIRLRIVALVSFSHTAIDGALSVVSGGEIPHHRASLIEPREPEQRPWPWFLGPNSHSPPLCLLFTRLQSHALLNGSSPIHPSIAPSHRRAS